MKRFRRSGETIAALFLFAAAALLMCGVVAFGAEDYAAIRSRTQTDAETAVQYIATKVHAADAERSIFVYDDRLMMFEDVDGREYVTKLYIYEGDLCELYHGWGIMLEDDAGLPILPAEKLEITADDGCFTVAVTSGGETRAMSFAPRGGYVPVGGGA